MPPSATVTDGTMKWTYGQPGESSTSRHTLEKNSVRTFKRPPPFNCSSLS